MKYANFIFVLLIFSSCATNKLKTASNQNKGFQEIIDSVYQANPEAIGIMAHIESPKKGISWSGGAGYADFKNKIPLQVDQPALIASSTKTYVAAAILRLQETGKLSIEDAISKHLPRETIELFEKDGYDFNQIKIKHLLSHTSGIQDYVGDDFFKKLNENPKYRWTRDEQLALAVSSGSPLGKAGESFNYADVNFLLSTVIIEQLTGKTFYSALKDLLKYKGLNLKHTWFPSLDNPYAKTKALVHQYWSAESWDSYDFDVSGDLYGGGGIATTTEELAKFSYHLFNENIIKDPNVLNLFFTRIGNLHEKDNFYGLGLLVSTKDGRKSYGHEGFWGTNVKYFPNSNTSIAVFVLDRDKEILMHTLTDKLIKAVEE